MIKIEDIKKYRTYQKYYEELFCSKKFTIKEREELKKLKKTYDEIKTKNEEIKNYLNAWYCGNSGFPGRSCFNKNPWKKQYDNNKKKMKEIKEKIFDINRTDKIVKRIYNDEENYALYITRYEDLKYLYFDKEIKKEKNEEILKEIKELYELTKKNKYYKKAIEEINEQILKEEKRKYKNIEIKLENHCNTINLRNCDQYLYYKYYDELNMIDQRFCNFCKTINSNKYFELTN